MATRDKQVRNGHQTHVERLIKELNNISDLTDTTNLDKFIGIKGILTEKKHILEMLNEQILSKIDEDSIESEMEKTALFDDKINIALALIDRIERQRFNQISENGQNSSNSHNTSANSSNFRARLPKLTLKTFDGSDLSSWIEFYENFCSLIHNNGDLLNVDKFSYLKSVLRHDAASCISGLPVTNDSYATAIDLLVERFGDSQKIVNKHMEHLLRIRRVENVNVKQLRKLYDEVEGHIRSLNSKGKSPDTYGELLVPVLLVVLGRERTVAKMNMCCVVM